MITRFCFVGLVTYVHTCAMYICQCLNLNYANIFNVFLHTNTFQQPSVKITVAAFYFLIKGMNVIF